MAPGKLRIGELAAQTGCHVETIRYYERVGLLPKAPRQTNGYRVYTDEHRARLIFIRRARELDFALDEIQGLLGLLDGGRYTCGEVQALALHHRAEIRQKIADLRRLDVALTKLSEQCPGGTKPACPIVDTLRASGR